MKQWIIACLALSLLPLLPFGDGCGAGGPSPAFRGSRLTTLACGHLG